MPTFSLHPRPDFNDHLRNALPFNGPHLTSLASKSTTFWL